MIDSPQDYVASVSELYQQHADPVVAKPMERYLKGQFEFFGIKKPERNILSKQIIDNQGIPIGEDIKQVCRLCFQEPQREMQYFVNDLLSKVIKTLGADFLEVLEFLILQKSWWDTVDFLAPKLAGKILQQYPEEIAHYPDRWIESDNIWLQRSAILFQLDYKSHTNAPLLFRYILRRADSKEFFVQKASGWALRQYARLEPETVQRFIHENELPKLTVREALKHFKT